MKNYQQLSLDQRYAIERMLNQGYKQNLLTCRYSILFSWILFWIDGFRHMEGNVWV